MAEDAIRCYLESALKQGEPIPEDKEPSLRADSSAHLIW